VPLGHSRALALLDLLCRPQPPLRRRPPALPRIWHRIGPSSRSRGSGEPSNFALSERRRQTHFGRSKKNRGREGALAELAVVAALARAEAAVVQYAVDGPSEASGIWRGQTLRVFPWMDGEILCQGRVTPTACAEDGRRCGDAACTLTRPRVLFLRARGAKAAFRIRRTARSACARVEQGRHRAYTRRHAASRTACDYEAERLAKRSPRGGIIRICFATRECGRNRASFAFFDLRAPARGVA